MQELADRSELKWQLFSLHKSFGVMLFSLYVLRLILRFNQKSLPCPAFSRQWHKRVFVVVHGMLYAMMLAMPITGYLLTSPYGVLFFGIELPVVREQFYIAGISRYFHGWFAIILSLLIIVHIIGYLSHNHDNATG